MRVEPVKWGMCPSHSNQSRAAWIVRYLHQLGFCKGAKINSWYFEADEHMEGMWRTCTDEVHGLIWRLGGLGNADVSIQSYNKTIKIYDEMTDQLLVLKDSDEKFAVHDLAIRMRKEFGVEKVYLSYVELVEPGQMAEIAFVREDEYTDIVMYKGWYIGDVTDMGDGTLYLTYYDNLEPFKPETEDTNSCKTEILIRGSEETRYMKDKFLEHARQFDVQAEVKRMKSLIWPDK